jgi:hypothetical protein
VGNLFLYYKNVGRHAREFAPHAMVIWQEGKLIAVHGSLEFMLKGVSKIVGRFLLDIALSTSVVISFL